MNILALETGGTPWGVACARFDNANGEAALLAVESSGQPRELSQFLFARIESTLQVAGWQLDDVDALAVGLGPGSWTGLRIGLSAAKTLAQVRGVKIIGVPSFDATAQAIWRARDEAGEDVSTLILVASPCRPGDVNAKIFESAADYLSVAQSEWIGSMELVADTLSTEALAHGIEAPPVLAGHAAPKVAELLDSRGEEYSVESPPFETALLELAIAAAVKLEAGEEDDVMSLQPLYLAPSNAERNLLGR